MELALVTLRESRVPGYETFQIDLMIVDGQCVVVD